MASIPLFPSTVPCLPVTGLLPFMLRLWCQSTPIPPPPPRQPSWQVWHERQLCWPCAQESPVYTLLSEGPFGPRCRGALSTLNFSKCVTAVTLLAGFPGPLDWLPNEASLTLPGHFGDSSAGFCRRLGPRGTAHSSWPAYVWLLACLQSLFSGSGCCPHQ